MTLALALSGCETMERLDYWDRYFEPAPRPMSVTSTEPQPEPAAPADRPHETGPVVAMEPIPNPPASYGRDREIQPGLFRAPEPRPNPATPPATADTEERTRLLVRQNQWLTQFWMELTPAQQTRVRRQLRRGEVVLASGQADPAAAWDSMGLSDRARLIFGADPPAERPTPPERRGNEVLARDS